VAKAFKHGLKGITGFLEPAERELLRSLFADVISMLEPADRGSEDPLAAMIGLDMEVREPSDRALRRLLPDAVKDDAAPRLSSASSPNAHCGKARSARCAPPRWAWTRTSSS
jgi:hypothetical protein